MPTQPCRTPGCPALVTHRYCAKHTQAASREPRQRGHRALYRTKRWRVLRRRVLREQPICPCGELTREVDHIIPVEDGGPMWDRANLQAFCPRCHARKTNADVRSRRWTVPAQATHG